MKLPEAIATVLKDAARPMRAAEIAAEIKARGLYAFKGSVNAGGLVGKAVQRRAYGRAGDVKKLGGGLWAAPGVEIAPKDAEAQ